jgi:hypothetical protein
MNFKNFTSRILAATLLTGLLSMPTMGQNQLKRSIVSQLETGLTPATTRGRQLKPVATAHPQIQRNGKVERINKAPGDTLFFQDFEGANWPADMPRVNRDGKTPANATWVNNAWVINSNVGGVAGRYACSTSWYAPAGAADDWMITPEITITPGNLLSWKSQAYEAAYPDGYEVRLCTNCPATFTNTNVETSFSTVLFSVAEDQAVSFQPHEVDLSAYVGQTVRIAFRNNSNDMNLLFVDDILVSRQPALDISADLIFSPSNEIYNCSRANFPGVASISNKGSNTAYNIGVKLISAGPINDTISLVVDSLEKGMSDTLVFADGLNMSTVGLYSLKLETTLVDDEIPGNNTSISEYVHNGPEDAPFSTNFDGLNPDSTLPAEWFCTSRFLPFNETAGFNGSQSIELPVFNVLGTQAPQPICQLISAKYKNIPANSYLTFKYKIQTVAGAEYSMIEGDTIFVNVWKNCQLIGSVASITSVNHETSLSYKKIFAALDPLGLTATDEVTFQFLVKAAPTTPNFLVEMDDFNIGAAPTNDVAMIDLERYPFSQHKRLHMSTIKIKGSVFNEGTNDLSPVRILADVMPIGLQDTARVTSLPSGTGRSFTTNPGINITNNGTFSFAVNASSPGVTDPNPADNILNFDVEATDSTMAKDYGDPFETAFMQYGAGSTGKRIMANAIRTVLRDTMTSVSVYVGPLAETCVVKAFFASKNAQGAWSEDSSAVAVTITPDDANSWIPLRFWKNTAAGNKGRAVQPNTENLYGVKLRTGNLRVGFNFENATVDGSFIWLGTSFLGTQDVSLGTLTGPFGLFIRANFGRTSTILTSATQLEQALQNADIVPNPAYGIANLVYSTKEGGNVTMQIFSVSGQLMSQNTQVAFQGTNRLEIPMKGLSKGMYLVKVNANGFSATKKLIVE